jgi:hypothetical protein
VTFIMQRLTQNRETVTLQLTHAEAATLCNALNETLECLEEWEFATRMGVTAEEVTRLLNEFSQIPPP